MSISLFPTIARPVTPRWTDPGEQKKKRHQVKRRPDEPRRVPNVKDKPYKPNPYRQPIADAWEAEFRHMNWQAVRDKVAHAMHDAGTSEHTLTRFANCGAECMVEWSDDLQKYRLRASFCKCRHCQPCMKARQRLIAGNLTKKLEKGTAQEGHRFRFITLTLRHTRRPLAEQKAELYKAVKQLRKFRCWKETQVGGAIMFENKLNDRGEWHPHIHIISEGTYLSQKQLADQWFKITNGSFKVDIRSIKGVKDAANYVSKYACKGVDDSVWKDHEKAIEWVTASHRLRSCATFGTWRGFALLGHDPAESVTDWKPVALLTRIVAQAAAGSIADSNLLHILVDTLQYNPLRPWKRDRQSLVDT
jgi:hypothetical protein